MKIQRSGAVAGTITILLLVLSFSITGYTYDDGEEQGMSYDVPDWDTGMSYDVPDVSDNYDFSSNQPYTYDVSPAPMPPIIEQPLIMPPQMAPAPVMSTPATTPTLPAYSPNTFNGGTLDALNLPEMTAIDPTIMAPGIGYIEPIQTLVTIPENISNSITPCNCHSNSIPSLPSLKLNFENELQPQTLPDFSIGKSEQIRLNTGTLLEEGGIAAGYTRFPNNNGLNNHLRNNSASFLPKIELNISDTADGKNTNIDLSFADNNKGLKITFGNIEGCAASPLDKSTYEGFTWRQKKNLLNNHLTINYGLGVYDTELRQDAADKHLKFFSGYLGIAGRIDLTGNLGISLGLAGEETRGSIKNIELTRKNAVVAMGYRHYSPTLSLGTNLSYVFSNKDKFLLGGSVNWQKENALNVQNALIEPEMIETERNFWGKLITNKLLPKPLDIEVNYKDTRADTTYNVSTALFNNDRTSKLEVIYEKTDSKYEVFPDKEKAEVIYCSQPLKYLNNGDIDVSLSTETDNYGYDKKQTEKIFTHINVPLGKMARVTVEKDIGKGFDNEELKRIYPQSEGASVTSGEINNAILDNPDYNSFNKNFLQPKVKNDMDVLAVMSVSGDNLNYYNYNDGDTREDIKKINTISKDEIYAAGRQSLITGEDVPATRCRGIMPFLSNVANDAKVKGVSAYSVNVEYAESGHIISPVVTPSGLYTIDYENVLSGSNLENTLQAYQKETGVVAIRHRIYSPMEYITDVSTPDTRLIKKTLTVQEGRTAADILKSTFNEIIPPGE